MSITNARQYRISRAQLERFQQAIEAAGQDRGPRSVQEGVARDALLAQAREQADELRRQLEEYTSIAGSRTMTLEIHSPSDLPSALIHARIASGLTQKDLAERIGVTQQQVQRDEQTDYAQVSLERLQRVWDALGARLHGQATLSPDVECVSEISSEGSDDLLSIGQADQISRASRKTSG